MLPVLQIGPPAIQVSGLVILIGLWVALGLAHLASGSAFGAPSNVPWAIELWGTRRQPTQIYEIGGAALNYAPNSKGEKQKFMSDLTGKWILITGGARRIGRALALAVAGAGADVILHYGHSQSAAQQTASEIRALGRQVRLLQADLNHPEQIPGLIQQAVETGPLYGLVNNAAIFEPLNWADTTLEAWERHLNTNLTAPFLLSQAFAKTLVETDEGRIINILDWRALRPGADHFPYTISKAGLAAVTQSLAVALAPRICVNGLALGAVLPPSDNAPTAGILDSVPAGRWANLEEAGEALIFLLTGPAYITGDIIYLDGGRHLV